MTASSTWTSSTGLALGLIAIGFAIMGGTLALPRHHNLVGWPGVGLVLTSYTLVGHAAGDGTMVMLVAAVLHAACAMFWIGSLLPLLATLRQERATALAILRRFAIRAVIAVGLLCVGGAVLALDHVGSIDVLLASLYGQVLVAKLAAVAVLLGMASWNRFKLTPQLADNHPRAPARLSASIRGELGLSVVIVGLAAILGMTPLPAPTAMGAPGAHHHTHAAVHYTLAGEGLNAVAELSPGRAGPNRMTVRLSDAAGRIFEPREVTIEMALPSSGVGGMRRRLALVAPGTFTHEGTELAVAGNWAIRLEILINDFKMVALEGDWTIR
jgi:copper transport protein